MCTVTHERKQASNHGDIHSSKFTEVDAPIGPRVTMSFKRKSQKRCLSFLCGWTSAHFRSCHDWTSELLTDDLVQSLIYKTHISLQETTNSDLAPFVSNILNVPPHFVNVQSALRCHDCNISLRGCSRHESVVEWNALFKKPPPKRFCNMLRLGTRWKAFYLHFGALTPAQCRSFCLHTCWTHLLQLRGCCM